MTPWPLLLLPALFCMAIGAVIGWWVGRHWDGDEPTESNVVDLPVGVRRHSRLVRSEEG